MRLKEPYAGTVFRREPFSTFRKGSPISPAAQSARLEFGAPHATSFVVFRKGPDDADFKQVADVLLPGVYEAGDLPPGENQFKVMPENSRGRGPESTVSTVVVALAAAA